MPRCPWATKELDIQYHDREWGMPLHDDRALFELLILEGAQAGLSWSIVLAKRDNYRKAFDGFDPEKIARYDARKEAELMANPGIIRNRLKIAAAIGNAKAYLKLRDEEGHTLDAFLWSFVGGKPIQNTRHELSELPARTVESDAMSKALLKRGFKFVGSTICYAFMQAAGLVNDHLIDCPRHQEVKKKIAPGIAPPSLPQEETTDPIKQQALGKTRILGRGEFICLPIQANQAK